MVKEGNDCNGELEDADIQIYFYTCQIVNVSIYMYMLLSVVKVSGILVERANQYFICAHKNCVRVYVYFASSK